MQWCSAGAVGVGPRCADGRRLRGRGLRVTGPSARRQLPRGARPAAPNRTATHAAPRPQLVHFFILATLCRWPLCSINWRGQQCFFLEYCRQLG